MTVSELRKALEDYRLSHPNCEKCGNPSTTIASKKNGRDLGCYCDECASEIVYDDSPEYRADCPLCGCMFGVN